MPHPTSIKRHPTTGDSPGFVPRVIAWEVTRRCPMSCVHCRGAAMSGPYEGELSTEECMRVLEGIAEVSRPVLILTGGEPMLREDIYEIAGRATDLGMRVVMAPCGLLVDEESAREMLEAGIRCISISLDGASAESHDSFRGRDGAFAAALASIRTAREAGMAFQINTTVTRHNREELPELLEMAAQMGARAFNPFMLVPTGRGKQLADMALGPEEQEQVLRWLAFQSSRPDIRIRVTCGPQYQRILRQIGQKGDGTAGGRHGCLGGKSFAFISHRGKVQICGFLEQECGDIRAADYDFGEIWRTSPVFRDVRQEERYAGRCGICEYRKACGGCRARAQAATGDYMGEEPGCSYHPRAGSRRELDERERTLLSVVQTDFPLCRRPYDALAEELDCDPEEVLEMLRRLRSDGLIRRFGAVFDSRRLGFVSTLVAARVPEERLREVAALISRLPEVTHNYRRTHEFNLWFTLRAPSQDALDEKLQHLREETGVNDLYSLPAEAVYNRSVTFDLTGKGSAGSDASERRGEGSVELTARQKDLARVLEAHLPLVERPFDWAARRAGWEPQEVLEQIEEWISQGVVRRIACIVHHRRLGFSANGMAAFEVPPERVDEVGEALAALPHVSHCYRRRTVPTWPYNLFGMVHDESREKVEQHVADFVGEMGLESYEILYSTEEYKKTSPRLFWEES